MDRKAFKQRMQELKSYREQNPGKGYLDWKASKYAEGGEIPPERMEYKGKLYTDKMVEGILRSNTRITLRTLQMR